MNFPNRAVLIQYCRSAGYKEGIAQAHFSPGSKAIVLFGRIHAKIVALNVEFPREANLSGSVGRILGVQGHFEDFLAVFREVIHNNLDRIQHCHPAGSVGVEILADAEFKQAELDCGVRSGHADAAAELMQGFGRHSAAAHGAQCGHAGIVPAADNAGLDKLDELSLGKDGVRQIEAGEFRLFGMVDIEGLKHPVVEFAIVHKLQRAQGVCNAFHGVAQGMREIIHRVDAPLVPCSVMVRVPDTVDGGIAHDNVGRGHVYFGP